VKIKKIYIVILFYLPIVLGAKASYKRLPLQNTPYQQFILDKFDKNTNNLSKQTLNGYGTGAITPDRDELIHFLNSSELISVEKFLDDSLPGSFDNSELKYFPPIGNQGIEGSCVAWATGYYVKTFQEARERNWDLSGYNWIKDSTGYPDHEAQSKVISPDFIYHLTNNGQDRGISVFRAINFMQKYGASSWQKMPNDPNNSTRWPGEDAWREAVKYRGVSSPIFLVDTNQTQNDFLKKLIRDGKLALIHVNAYRFPQLDQNDLWTIENYQTNLFNHLNAVVGYDDNFGPYIENGDTTYGAFKVVNNWGKGGWENQSDGFYYISYECFKEYIQLAIFFEDRIGYTPSVLANFKLDHQHRGEIQIDLGIEKNHNSLISREFIEYNNGSDRNPFPDNTMVMDISDFSGILNLTLDSIYIDINNRSNHPGPAQLDSFYIEFTESSLGGKNNFYLDDGNTPVPDNQELRENIIIYDDVPIAISKDRLNFGKVFIDDSASSSIKIYNSSARQYSVSLSLDNPNFKIQETGIELSPGETKKADILFHPKEKGNFESNLALNYGEDNKKVHLSGKAIGIPEIIIEPEELFINKNVGELARKELYISNPGSDTINYRIQLALDSTISQANQSLPGWYPSNIKVLCFDNNVYPGEQSITQEYLKKIGLITDLVTNVERLDDSLIAQYDILYVARGDVNVLRDKGNSIQKFIRTGGGIIIEQPDREQAVRIMPPGLDIMVLNDDQEANPEFRQLTPAGKEHPIFNGLSSADSPGNYDVIKREGLGEEFQILAVNSLDTNNVILAAGNYGKGRILLHTGNTGIRSQLYSKYFIQRIMEWTGHKDNSINISPYRGQIYPGMQDTVEILTDTEFLYNGRYNISGSILTQDIKTIQKDFALQMNLKGQPELELQQDSLLFQSVFLEEKDSLLLNIYNTGTAILKIDRLFIEGSDNFSTDHDSVDILPGRDEQVKIYFQPANSGFYEASLVLEFNNVDGNTSTVKVRGEGIIPPMLGSLPDSIVRFMKLNDSLRQNINLTNNGQALLEFDASITGAEKSIIREHQSGFSTYVSGLAYHNSVIYYIKRTGNKLYKYYINDDLTEELFTIPYNSYSLCYDGTYFYIGTNEGEIYGYDQNGEKLLEIDTPFNTRITFTHNGSNFIVCEAYSSKTNFVVLDNEGETIQNIHYSGCRAEEVCVQLSWIEMHEKGKLWGIFYNYRTENYWLNQLRYNGGSIEFIRRYQLLPGAEALTYSGEHFWVSSISGSLLKIKDRVEKLKWLQLSQNQGSIQPYNQKNIELKFHTRNMDPGKYRANVTLTTNDPNKEIIEIAARLNLSGNYILESKAGWQMLGTPVEPVSLLLNNIINIAADYSIYGWNQSYYIPDSIFQGQGFWLKKETKAPIEFVGLPDNVLSLGLAKGWNLISGISSPIHIAQIMDNNDILLFPQIYKYANSYTRTDSILPGQGYWVKAESEGSIRLKKDATYLESQMKIFDYLPDLNQYPFLTLQDSDSNKAEIYYSVEFNYDGQNEYFQLPPVPPDKAFDVRTLDGYFATAKESFPIRLQSSFYPVQITNFKQNSDTRFSYKIIGEDGKEFEFNNEDKMTIYESDQDTLHFQRINTDPTDFHISHNYPNPFNTTTHIEYGLPEETKIKIMVFDLLGNRIKTLYSGIQQTGYHKIMWHGTNNKDIPVVSGIYFLVFKSKSYNTSYKMILLK